MEKNTEGEKEKRVTGSKDKPCSYMKPSKLEQPGPPLSQRTTGSVAAVELSEVTK